MTIAQALKNALLPFVQDAVNAAESKLASLLPGLAGKLVEDAFAIPAVQAEITMLEGKAVDGVVVLAGKAFDLFKDAALSHVHGQLGAWLGKELSKPITINLTVAQEQKIIALLAAGKLDDALKAVTA